MPQKTPRLIDYALLGFSGAEWSSRHDPLGGQPMYGSANWMAWRAGLALRDEKLGRPVAILPPCRLLGWHEIDLRGIAMTALPADAPPQMAAFALFGSLWLLHGIRPTKLSVIERMTVALQRSRS